MKARILILGLVYLYSMDYSSVNAAQDSPPSFSPIRDLAAQPLAPDSLDAHVLDLAQANTGKTILSASVRVDGQRTRVQFKLPSRTLCLLKVEAQK